jgi:hypothetical protein
MERNFGTGESCIMIYMSMLHDIAMSLGHYIERLPFFHHVNEALEKKVRTKNAQFTAPKM